MKKLLVAVTVVLLLVTTSAFADITIGAWLRTVFTPIASDGENNYTDMGNSWGEMRQSRINVAGTAGDELAGFKADFYINNGSVGTGDNAYIWVKPIDMIKVAYGKYDGPEAGFRGDLCYGSWDWLRPSFVGYDEGLTFSANGSEGAMVILNPIENLTIYGLVPTSGSAAYDADTRSFLAYGNSEVAAAYTIDGIGKIKAGYFGKYEKDGDYERLGDIEAAFDLTAVEGLYVTAGFRYSLGDDEALAAGHDLSVKDEGSFDMTDGSFKPADAREFKYLSNMKIALGASYQVMDGFKISASGQVFLYPDYSDFNRETDPTFDVGAGIAYDIMDGLALNADVRYHSETKVEGEGQEDDGISFLVGLDKTVGSNGSIGLGFQGVTNGRGFNKTLQYEDKFAWAIPVKVQVSF